MASKTLLNLSARDAQILSSLIKTPLDAKQLLSLSQSFDQPFTSNRLVRRRLSQLVDAGLVSRFQYSTIGAGSVNYYKPTPSGYRMLEGLATPLPPRAYFRAVSLSLQEHTRALADFIVKTHLNAHSQAVELGDFYRENQLRLQLRGKTLQPDCAFQLFLPDGRKFNYLVEIDCGSEPIRSTKQRESLEQKMRFYDEYQDTIDKRFRVIVLFTKPSARLQHFLQIADEVIRDPQRTLFCAGMLSGYLQSADTMFKPLFLDRDGNTIALAQAKTAKQITSVPARKRPDLLAK